MAGSHPILLNMIMRLKQIILRESNMIPDLSEHYEAVVQDLMNEFSGGNRAAAEQMQEEVINEISSMIPEDVVEEKFGGDEFDAAMYLVQNDPEWKEIYDRLTNEYVMKRVDDAGGMLQQAEVKNGYVKVFREITAPFDWPKKIGERGLGIYWSFDEERAEAHWGDFKDSSGLFLIEGWVKLEHVNWITTLVQNASPSYELEREIRVEENAPILIEEIWFSRYKNRRNYGPVSEEFGLSGKVFPA